MKIVWFRTPKCAGRQIRGKLERNKLYLSDQYPNENKVLCVRPEVDWKRVRNLNPDFWDNAWKFAVVRNPWDRFISGCQYIKQNYPGRCKGIYNMTLKEIAFNLPTKRNSLGEVHITRTLSSIITHKGRLLVDHVIKLEELDDGWGKVCDKIGVDIKLEKSNTSERLPYKEYFNDDQEFINRVAEIYAEDIERFGYTYE